MAVDLINSLLLCTLCMPLYGKAWMHRDQKHSLVAQSWRNRSLRSVPVELDFRLQALDLSNNAIERLNVLKLKALEKLDLSYNHLKFIEKGAFENLLHLDYINLAMNLLDSNVIHNSEAFWSLYGVKYLDISLNNLDDNTVGLYIQNATALKQLTLNGNGLTKLSQNMFANNRNLVNIEMEDNNILEIEEGTFEAMKTLSMLNLARNNLPHVCDFQLGQVTLLNLSQNSIEFFFTNQNEQAYLLETLDLSYNNLLYFPVVPIRNKLRNLLLQFNHIGALGFEISISEGRTLHQNVTQTSETHNPGNSHDLNLQTLQYIDLSANDFTDFSVASLCNFLSLETLSLRDNCLQNISDGTLLKDSLPSLHHVNLQNNAIEHLPQSFFDFLPKLETLDLSQNGVKLCADNSLLPEDTCVSLRGAHSLKHLDLDENGIKTIVPNAFANTQLKSLNLAGNTNLLLGKESLNGLQGSLEELSIAYINTSRSHMFTPCLTKLRVLNVSHNRLADLLDLFSCSPLEVLDLQSNNFTSLNFLLTHMAQELDIIYISNNALNCCDMKWINVLNEKGVRIADMEEAKCQYQTGEDFTFHSLQNHSMQCQWDVSEADKTILWVILSCLIIFLTVVTLVKVMCAKGSLFI